MCTRQPSSVSGVSHHRSSGQGWRHQMGGCGRLAACGNPKPIPSGGWCGCILRGRIIGDRSLRASDTGFFCHSFIWHPYALLLAACVSPRGAQASTGAGGAESRVGDGVGNFVEFVRYFVEVHALKMPTRRLPSGSNGSVPCLSNRTGSRGMTPPKNQLPCGVIQHAGSRVVEESPIALPTKDGPRSQDSSQAVPGMTRTPLIAANQATFCRLVS